MTVVTRKFADITKRPDYYKFQFETGLRRSTDDPDVTITPKRVDAVPSTVGGEAVLSVDLDPGPCRVWYRGVSHIIEIPESGPADLQDLIDAGTVENGAPEIPSNSVALRGRSFDGMELDGTDLVGLVGNQEACRVDLSPVIPGAVWNNIAQRPPIERIMRPNGGRLGGLGDSLQSLAYASTSSSQIAPGGAIIMRRIEWLSRGRVRITNPHQDPGDTMADVLNTQLPALLADTVQPNACVVAIGRNDVGASFNLSTYLDQYTSIANQLFARGICPIFFTPMPTGAAGSPTATADANLRRLSAGLLKLGAQIGVPVFDQYAVLADEAGGIKAAYNSGDNVHLNAAGYQAVAEYIIDQGFLELFPKSAPRTIKDTAQSYDLMAGAGLFKDAFPTGFSVAGTGTSVSFVSPTAGDGIAGRWARVTKVSGSTASGAYRFTKDTAVTPGHVYRFSGHARLYGAWGVDGSPSNYVQIAVEWRTAGVKTNGDVLVNRWDVLDPITFTQDFTVPAGTDGMRVVVFLNGTAVGDQIVDLAEWSAINLTSMGI